MQVTQIWQLYDFTEYLFICEYKYKITWKET